MGARKREGDPLADLEAPPICTTIEKEDLAVFVCSPFAPLDCDLGLRHDLGVWNEHDMSGWNHEDCDTRLLCDVLFCQFDERKQEKERKESSDCQCSVARRL